MSQANDSGMIKIEMSLPSQNIDVEKERKKQSKWRWNGPFMNFKVIGALLLIAAIGAASIGVYWFIENKKGKEDGVNEANKKDGNAAIKKESEQEFDEKRFCQQLDKQLAQLQIRIVNFLIQSDDSVRTETQAMVKDVAVRLKNLCESFNEKFHSIASDKKKSVAEQFQREFSNIDRELNELEKLLSANPADPVNPRPINLEDAERHIKVMKANLRNMELLIFEGKITDDDAEKYRRELVELEERLRKAKVAQEKEEKEKEAQEKEAQKKQSQKPKDDKAEGGK